jgi:hypothetical protein
MTAARAGWSFLLLTTAMAGFANAEEGESQHLHSRVELMAGPELLSRSFEFRDERFSTLPAYELRAAPALRALLRMSASAFAPDRALDHLQLFAGVEQGLGLRSRLEDAETDTGENAWELGLRVRIPWEAHELAGELGYGQHSFFFVGDSPRTEVGDPALPSVRYSFMRWGLEARAELDDAILGVRLGHRFVAGAGDIGSDEWFPRLEVQGLDAGVLVGWAFSDRLGLLLGADLRRYWYDLNPHPDLGASTRNQVAGGAIDIYTTWWLALAWWVDPPRAPAAEEEL